MINLKKALFQAFMNHTDLDQSVLQVPNINFTPPQNAIWARLNFIPNQPEVDSLGNYGLDRVDGIFQVDFNSPQGQGEDEILTLAENARSHFSAGRHFKYNEDGCTDTVKVMSSGFANGQVIDNFYRIIFTVNWYAQLTRNINSNT